MGTVKRTIMSAHVTSVPFPLDGDMVCVGQHLAMRAVKLTILCAQVTCVAIPLAGNLVSRVLEGEE
jgi:hypothetical protein